MNPSELPSLLDASQPLPGLAPDPEAELGLSDVTGGALARPGARTAGESTGDRIAKRNPRLYAMAARMLVEGCSDQAVSRVTDLRPESVAAIRRREWGALTSRQFGRLQGRSLRLAVSRAVEEIHARLADPERCAEMTARDLAYLLDRMGHYERILAGEPTEIAAQVRSEGTDEAIRALLANVSVREVTPDVCAAPYAIHSPVGNDDSCEGPDLACTDEDGTDQDQADGRTDGRTRDGAE